MRKNKTMDGELSRKVESHHISKKLQGTSKISLKLRKYDNLSWQEFLAASRDTRVPLTSIPPRENLTIYLTGDTALSSLDVKTLKEVEKVKDFHILVIRESEILRESKTSTTSLMTFRIRLVPSDGSPIFMLKIYLVWVLDFSKVIFVSICETNEG